MARTQASSAGQGVLDARYVNVSGDTMTGPLIASGNFVLGTSDTGALGSTTKMWSDLFLANGAVINFNN